MGVHGKASRTIVRAGAVGLAAAVARRGRRIMKIDPQLRGAFLWAPTPLRGPKTLWIARKLAAKALGDEIDAAELEGVELRSVEIPGGLDAFVYEPSGRSGVTGAVLYTHGGGFIMGSPEEYHELCIKLARELAVPVVSTRYRLAPEYPYPAGLDDSMAALRWLHASAAELGVDPERIALAGDSAGGGMAATLAQRAHDEGVPVAFQALIYPMLDDLTPLRSDDEGRGVFVWNATANRYAWGAYLGRSADWVRQPKYLAAARRENLSGLPPAWIGVGDLDLFYLEDREYVERLRAAGVAVTELIVPRMYHGADSLIENSELMDDFHRQLIAAIAGAIG